MLDPYSNYRHAVHIIMFARSLSTTSPLISERDSTSSTNSLAKVQIARFFIININGFNPSMKGNYIHYKLWDDIIYQFPNFNDCTG